MSSAKNHTPQTLFPGGWRQRWGRSEALGDQPSVRAGAEGPRSTWARDPPPGGKRVPCSGHGWLESLHVVRDLTRSVQAQSVSSSVPLLRGRAQCCERFAELKECDFFFLKALSYHWGSQTLGESKESLGLFPSKGTRLPAST